MDIVLELAKETKNKLVYRQENADVDTIYIDKRAPVVAGKPTFIRLQISVPE